MKKKTAYYVYRNEDGSTGRLAMFGYVDGKYGPHGYVPGKGWEFMPGLGKILWEVTSYEEISEAEAKKIMEALDSE